MSTARELGSLLGDLAVRDPHMSSLVLSTPWGASHPGSGGHPGIYVVSSGTAWLAVDGDEAIELTAGDVAVLPHGRRHVLTSAPALRVGSLEEFCATASVDAHGNVVGGGGGTATEIRTLCFRVEGSAARAVTSFAPALVVLRHEVARPWLSSVVRATLDVADEEARTRDVAVTRLGELLLVEALRRIEPGAASVFADRAIARAALALRARVSEGWTVARLAREVGLSRSAFFDRFTREMGCAPGEYLLRARMEEAAVLLEDSARSVEEIATAVGYRASSSFSVAFRRYHGASPKTFRTARRGSERSQAEEVP